MDQQITQFFNAYVTDYKNKRPTSLLDKLCTPFTFLSDNGPIVLSDKKALSENFERLISHYQTLGIKDYRFTIKQLQPLSDTVTQAKLDWQFLDESGDEIYNSSTSYFLLRDGEKIKIMSILLHDEQEKLKEALEQICKEQAVG